MSNQPKQKTAVQQFADFMGISYDDPYIKVFIDKERQQIIDAYSAAGHEYYDKSFNETTSVAWFNKKYGSS
jgi:hypothetical protein